MTKLLFHKMEDKELYEFIQDANDKISKWRKELLKLNDSHRTDYTLQRMANLTRIIEATDKLRVAATLIYNRRIKTISVQRNKFTLTKFDKRQWEN